MIRRFTKALLLCTLLFSTPAWAADYYFNYSAGNNANACGSGSKCRDFDGKGLDNLDALSPGDNIFLECGETWPEGFSELAVNSNGSSGSHITVNRFGTCTGSNDPVLLGSTAASTWTLHGSGTNVYSKTFGAYRSVFTVGVDGTSALNYWGGSIASMPAGSFQGNFATPTTVYIRLADGSNPSGHTIYVPSTVHNNSNGNRGLLRGGKENTRGRYVDFKNIKVLYANGIGFSSSGLDNRNENIEVVGGARDGILAYYGGSEDSSGFRCKNCKWSYNAMMGSGYGQGFTSYAPDSWVYGDEPVGGVYTCVGHDNGMAGADFLDFGSANTYNSGIFYCELYKNSTSKQNPSFDPNLYIDGANNIMAWRNKMWGEGTVGILANGYTGASMGSEASNSQPAHHIYMIGNLIFGNHWMGLGSNNANGGPNNISDLYWIGNTVSAYDSGSFDLVLGFSAHTSTADSYHIKNNIFIADNSLPVSPYMPSEPVGTQLSYIDADYNLYWRRGGYSIIYGTNGSACQTSTPSASCWDLARWRTNVAQEANSQFADPLITTNSDTAFDPTLQAGSPALNAGLANPYPIPTWLPSDLLSAFPDLGSATSGSTIASGVADSNAPDLGFHRPASGSTIGALTSTNVALSTAVAGATGTLTISFTTATSWPLDGKIALTFPTTLGGGYTFNSGGSTAAGGISGFDGSLAVSVASNVVTVTRSAGTAASAGAKSFTLSQVQNPPTDGSTNVYQFKTTNSSDAILDQDLNVVADTITGSTLYVATTGNDSNPGTFASPFLTIQKCVDTATLPGMTCEVADGTYTARFIVSDYSGTESAPITIKATNRGAVTIDTSTTISGWVSLGSNKWISSPSTSSVSSLWRVGRTTLLTLQASAGAVTGANQYYFNSSTKEFTIYSTTDPSLDVYKQAGAGNAAYGVSYILIDGFVMQYAVVPMGVGYSSGFPTPAAQLLEPGTSYVTVQYCTAQYGVQWGMAAHTASTNLTSHITFDNVTIRYVDEAAGGQNGHCFKCSANNNADNGTYTTISNSTIHDCRYHGIQSSNAWSHNVFNDNRIYNYSLSGSGAGAGIRCGWSGSADPMACEIYNNDIGGGSGGTGNSIGSGIYLQDYNVDSVVYNNVIHDNNWHGVYMFYTGGGAASVTNAKIYNNVFYNNGTSGVRSDNNASAAIYNNTFVYNGEAALFGTGASLSLRTSLATNITFKNNIVHNTSAASIYTSNSYQLSSDYNDLFRVDGFRVWWNNTQYNSLVNYQDATVISNPSKWDMNTITTDPIFIGPNAENYKLPQGSPAYQTGTDLSAVFNTDNIGAVRSVPFDMGAYLAIPVGDITSASVTPSDLNAAASTNVAVAFTLTTTTITPDGKIVIIFPDGYEINNGGTTTVTSITGFDGTATVSVTGRAVTIQRVGDGTIAAPGAFTFTLTHIKNPFIPGTTAAYNILIRDAQDTLYALNSEIAGTEIVGLVVPVATIGGAVVAGSVTY